MSKTTALLFAISLITLSGCGVGQADDADLSASDTSAPLPVEVSLPIRDDIFATYHATANLRSDVDAPVLTRAAGEVLEILVEEGDQIAEGQALAKLDGKRLRLQLRQAKANLDMKKSEYERMRDLHKRSLISTASFEDLRFDVEALSASYDLMKLNSGYTTIRAPFAGVISVRNIKIGQQLRINSEAFRVTDGSELIAHLKIPQSELVRFAAGQSIRLSVDAVPETTFKAIIDRISPTIDVQTGTFRATAFIDNRHGHLAPGMFARFSVAYEKHEDVMLIPTLALIREDNISVVYVVDNGEAVRRIIETGIETDGMVEVISGLAFDEKIVTLGQTSLRNGSRVLANNAKNEHKSG